MSAPPPLPTLENKVRHYTVARRRFIARDARGRTATILLCGALGVMLTDISSELPEWQRWVALGMLVAMGVGLLLRWWVWPASAWDAAASTREVEHGFPELGQRLRTTLEVAKAGEAPALAGALREDTQRRMKALDPLQLIPWGKLRGPFWAATGLAMLCAVLWAVWPDFRVAGRRLLLPGTGWTFTTVAIEQAPATFTDRENPQIVARISGRPAAGLTLHVREEGGPWTTLRMSAAGPGRFDAFLIDRKVNLDLYVTGGDGRSEMRHLRCLVAPKIVKAAADLTFPEYTGLPPQHQELGDVKAVEGTVARVTLQLNHALTAASARTADGQDLKVTISGSQLLLEQTLGRGEVVYRIAGRDADGLELAPMSYKLVGVEDKLPEVELVEPGKDVEATTVWEILARLKAKDDFGLAEVGIVLVVGDKMKVIEQRKFPEKNIHSASEMGTAMLEEFPLQITDNLKLYAYARDHKPRDGVRAVSNLRAIDIRQFKTRWHFGLVDGMPMSGAQFQELLDLIKEQRQVVSDIFVLKESGAPEGVDLGARCAAIREHEEKIGAATLKLKTEVEAMGLMNRDDLVLLEVAAAQMGGAAKALAGRQLIPAYRQADHALSSLLQLRKEIEILLLKSKQAMPMPSEGEEKKAKSPTDLAAEAERLAKEEHEVREKVSAPIQPHDLEVTQHQQEVAVTDAGELYAGLVANPELTELALQRMDDAEKSMQKAEETMRSTEPGAASPDLKHAEEKLLELAAQLRALDEQNMSETMGKLAQMAEKAKERLEQEKKDRASGKQEGPGDAKAEAKPGDAQEGKDAPEPADQAKGEGEKPASESPAAGKGEGEKKGDEGKQGETGKQGDGKQGDEGKQGEGKNGSGAQGQGAGQGQGKSGPDSPSEKEGADPGTRNNAGGRQEDASARPGEKGGAGKMAGEEKGREGEKPGAGQHSGAEDKAGGDGQKPGGEGAKENLGQVAEHAETLDDVLKNLAGKAGENGSGKTLSELRAQAHTDSLAPGVRDLDHEKDGAKAGEQAGGLAERFGQLAEGLNREQRRLQESRVDQLADALAKTKELEKSNRQGKDAQGKDEQGKDAQGKDAQGKDGKGKGGQGKGAQRDEDKGKADKNDSPKKGAGVGQGAAGASGRGGGKSEIEASTGGIGRGTREQQAYLKELAQLGDEALRGYVDPLIADLEKGTFENSHLQPVEKRLGKILDEMLRANLASRHNDRVPDEYDHLVDDYFRALSEDFAGEVK